MKRSAAFNKRTLRLLAWLAGFGGVLSLDPALPHVRAAQSDQMTIRININDSLPPAAVSDLAAAAGGEGQVNLTWTAPNEDGTALPGGPVAAYTVRMATFSAQSVGSTVTWWNNAIDPAEPEPAPLNPGQAQSMLLANLEPGATYWFAITSVDDAGLSSPMDDRTVGLVNQAVVVVADLVPPAPAGLTATAGNRQVSLSWNAVSAPDLDFYRIYVDSTTPYDFADAFTIVVDSPTVNHVHAGLDVGVRYDYRVTAVDKGAPNHRGVALESAPSATASATPTGDVSAPRAPHGFWAEWLSVGSPSQMRMHWRPVTKNEDGTDFTDPAPERYRIYRSQSLFAAAGDPASTVFSTDTVRLDCVLNPADTFYYRVAAVDAGGNESADPKVVVEASGDGAVLNVHALADDDRSRLVMPASTLAHSLLAELNGLGDDILIRGVRVTAEEKGRVVRSVRFEAYRASTGEVVKGFMFKPPEARVVIRYEVQNGQVVQGAPGGAAVVPADRARGELALFWHNGVQWVKLGGAVETGAQEVELRSGRLGGYQIRHALRVGPASLVAVYPRIFSPNGDGWNDKVIMQFDNPEQVSLKGEIFDLSGAKVADMTAGPSADSLAWDGKQGGRVVPGGVYIYQVEVAGESVTGTIVVAR
ncbi:MAG: gliding motility-associated C-terminal domain-containing protein [Elusimicrobiota bacterium]